MIMLPKHRSIDRLILTRGFYLNLSSIPINGNIHAVPFHVVFTFRAKGSRAYSAKFIRGARPSPEIQPLIPFFTKKILLSWLPSANPWYQLFVSNNSNLVKVTYFLSTSFVIKRLDRVMAWVGGKGGGSLASLRSPMCFSPRRFISPPPPSPTPNAEPGPRLPKRALLNLKYHRFESANVKSELRLFLSCRNNRPCW